MMKTKEMGKAGFVWDQFTSVALMILVLVIILVIYGILSGHGTSVINFFRDLVRFGR